MELVIGASLSNLTTDSGTLIPAFSSVTTTYSVDVGNSVSSIKVTTTANDAEDSIVTVNGNEVASGSALDNNCPYGRHVNYYNSY